MSPLPVKFAKKIRRKNDGCFLTFPPKVIAKRNSRSPDLTSTGMPAFPGIIPVAQEASVRITVAGAVAELHRIPFSNIRSNDQSCYCYAMKRYSISGYYSTSFPLIRQPFYIKTYFRLRSPVHRLSTDENNRKCPKIKGFPMASKRKAGGRIPLGTPGITPKALIYGAFPVCRNYTVRA